MSENKKRFWDGEVWRAIKYSLISATAGAIEFITFTLLNELTTWRYWPCYLIALILSIIWNFVINRRFTFKSTVNIPVAMLKIFGYYLVFTPVSTWGGDYLVETLGWNEYLVTALNLVFNLVTEYTFQRLVVYGKQVDNRGKKEEEPSVAPPASTEA
ncbi:MAG: GtrA family protein [Bacteroidales bacterium]|jgi:putative flippase GtrA|nr:GtrA family protein [Bacteroidales bacterium]